MREPMPSVNDVIAVLEAIAPLGLAETWDNVGLLVGDRDREAGRVMTCLTLTPTTACEAIEQRADLVVTHHPLPFKPVAQVTTESVVGRLLWDLIGARIAVYSAHTAFDSARRGINELLARGLELESVEPLTMLTPDGIECIGSRRCGQVANGTTLIELASRVKRFLSLAQLRLVGAGERIVQRVGIACGSGGSFLAVARAKGCDCLITGETNFHTCLEAEATDVAIILTGHYASERFAMERLAEELRAAIPQLEVWASARERDPIAVV